MKRKLLIGCVFLALSIEVYAGTYADRLGVENLQSMIEEEAESYSTATHYLGPDAVDWIANKIGGLEINDSNVEIEESLREGLGEFLTALFDSTGSGRIDAYDCEYFLNTEATCGMIPCPSGCCELCKPC